mgnify:CR=1 FL=1
MPAVAATAVAAGLTPPALRPLAPSPPFPSCPPAHWPLWSCPRRHHPTKPTPRRSSGIRGRQRRRRGSELRRRRRRLPSVGQFPTTLSLAYGRPPRRALHFAASSEPRLRLVFSMRSQSAPSAAGRPFSDSTPRRPAPTTSRTVYPAPLRCNKTHTGQRHSSQCTPAPLATLAPSRTDAPLRMNSTTAFLTSRRRVSAARCHPESC